MRHRFHSLCPYFAMFPESFVETWLDRLTMPGDVVLDPFCGRGTTALQAILMDRNAVSSDVNDVAYCLTAAKTNAPSLRSLRGRLTTLERGFDGRQWQHAARAHAEFFQMAFSPYVLQRLLYLRSELKWRANRTDAMIAGLVLGSLHGEMDKSSSYLSNQMPRTIATKPAYSVRYWKERLLNPPDRDVFGLLRSRAVFRYASGVPEGRSTVLHRDMRELPRLQAQIPRNIKCVITSPPYFDVTNFEEDQWLRLWFLGGPPSPQTRRLSRDDRHTSEDSYWAFIADMWRSIGAVLPPKAHVVIRIASARIDPERLESCLSTLSKVSTRTVRRISVDASEIRRRQTDAFRPGSTGCRVEIDCHYQFAD